MSVKRYVVRISQKEEVDSSIIVGDVVTTACYVGVVIGFTAKESGQYRVAVENGDIEDWINPDKIHGINYELHTIGDIVNAVGDLHKIEIDEQTDCAWA